jgi:mono/diheme cytochrome c family protein
MAFIARRTLYLLAGLTLGFVIAIAGLIWSGLYNIGADDPHTRPIYAVLEFARDRSIARRAAAIPVPDLSAPETAAQGAGNYDAMCTGCHLMPGAPPTELSRGLYPAPPNLSQVAVDPAEAFWTIKHGIKASGMPAWGESMDDTYIWNMVAFLQVLPKLDAAGYRDLVARSGGHSRGGGETDVHPHADAGTPAMPHDDGHPHEGPPDAMPQKDGHAHAPTAEPVPGDVPEPSVHRHADGSLHDHGAATDGAANAGGVTGSQAMEQPTTPPPNMHEHRGAPTPPAEPATVDAGGTPADVNTEADEDAADETTHDADGDHDHP